LTDTRIDKKRKRKRKKKRVVLFLTTVLLFFIVGISYVYYQYNQGLKLAGVTQKDNKENVVNEFNGVEEFDGEINVLLLGIDTRGEEHSRTDTIMIAQYNSETNQVKLVSLMRDMYVEIPGYQNYKINTAYFLGGPELLRKTIKHNFGTDLHYYALVDFKGFTKVVDVLAPDGVEIDVEKKMSENISVVLESGLQKLDGQELLGYARFRHDSEGDFGRVRRQQIVIESLKDELLSLNGITKLPKLLGTIQPYIETNISKLDALSIGKDFLMHPVDETKTLRIPVDGSFTDGFYEHAGTVLEIDFDKNKEVLNNFLNNDSNSKVTLSGIGKSDR
jgi:polyisoprenyl-teichoic acid--peptidoglycan teichoic acid transferase